MFSFDKHSCSTRGSFIFVNVPQTSFYHHTVDPHMGLVFFICCKSRFLPSGGLLKSQVLLPGWVVSEPSSGLEMQWGGDTCWRRFEGAFWLLERVEDPQLRA